ncbi:MAG TPA: acyl-homoserine-lactone synthase [Steroidobacteraceae bacterium]|nr:acyl-homoserine-lactone synthase [Steroidobacteraceae bacterium]
MIFVVDARNRRHFAADLAAMHCQRKAVFVDGAGWKLLVLSNKEIDRYDLLEETVYLLAKDEPDGPVLASARLLTTTGPHLMRDLYSNLYRTDLPSGPTVWEVSRYCTAPGIGGRSRRLGLLWETICGIMETAMHHGIDQVIFAANRALLPRALECGWDARVLGPTIRDASGEVTAVVAAITEDGLRNVQEHHRVPPSVIRHSTGVPSSKLAAAIEP